MVVISISAANIRDKDDDSAWGWHSWCHQLPCQSKWAAVFRNGFSLKWNSDSGLLEQAGTEKAPWGRRMTKNTWVWRWDWIWLWEGGRGWWVAVRSLPILCILHALLQPLSGPALPMGCSQPFPCRVHLCQQKWASSAVALALKHCPTATGLPWGATSWGMQHQLGSEQSHWSEWLCFGASALHLPVPTNPPLCSLMWNHVDTVFFHKQADFFL